MVKAEAPGKTLVFSALALVLFYALFQDVVILLAAIAAAALMLFTLFTVLLRARWIRRNCRAKPQEVSIRLVAGTVGTAKISVEAPKRMAVRVEHPMKFCAVKPQRCGTNEEITLEFAPKIAGTYNSGGLMLAVASPLNAFTVRVEVPFRTSLTVIPRVVPMAVRALELAAAMGALAYEVPLQAVGRGTEYAETREYLPGDDLRRLDWKATARLQKLMVKQYHQDAGGKTVLVYDVKAAGPISRDVAVTEFLNNAVALAVQNLPYAITIVDEKGETRTMEFKDARTALLSAVKYALMAVEVDYAFLYEFMEPQASREALMLLRVLGEEPLPLSKGKPLSEEPFNATVISCLLGDLTWLLDLHERARMRGGRLVVYAPSKVWLDSPTLEQAYLDYERWLRLVAGLKRRGVEVMTVDRL